MWGGVHLRDGDGGAIEMKRLSIGSDFEVDLFDSDGEMAIFGDMNETVIFGLVVELLKGTNQLGINYR